MEKKIILIYGAGGIARDIVDFFEPSDNYEIQGFIDDNKKENKINGLEVYTLQEAKVKYKQGFYTVIAIGDPQIKQKILNKIKDINEIKLTNIISNKAFIFPSCTLGLGNIIYPFSIVASNTKIVDNVLICGNCSIGHDAFIGNFSTISFNSTIGGNTKIGKAVFIGSGSHIRDEIEIKDRCTIGMGSKVLKSVEKDKIYYNKLVDYLTHNKLEGIFK
ncbi:acetyltransferase [Cetobacterium sp. 2A]|uniref:acetyltransferase n=1 Tax=Cetobacterium sp. 2A TaxID=2754723 RepID=UPI00163C97C2|nr:acetyltransferase [Cetobacterium sp. 2A]MBC2856181.1 acetyltransferase [Cetobacterium sp. 2A]